jgi:hypothetical protein
MNAIAFDPGATTLINVLTCDPANQAALVDVLRQNTDQVITTLDGWRSTSFAHASLFPQNRGARQPRFCDGHRRARASRLSRR